ncbi:hypothetical protein RI129_005696 [Pyrocoelia pectoralis]|uniref:Uncharacterized protein n=1 Tax=Pyrocoelia pectoralis TaxID=417401 RepID=A0AAN7VF25_9COLE
MSNLQESLQLVSDKECATTISKFPNICRTCLIEGENKPMFGITYEDKTVYDLIQLYTSITVHHNDGFPQNICRNCLADLFQMYSFIKKCQQSDVVLRYVLDIRSKHFLDDNAMKSERNLDLCDDRSLGQDSIVEDNFVVQKQELKVSKNRKCKKKSEKTGGSPHDCTICKETFESDKLLKAHRKLLRHFEIRKHACTVCGKLFTNSKLRQHMRAHTKEKPYKCITCMQGFSMSGNLKRHMMTHTGERPHVCEICGKGFIQSTTLHNHKKTHITDERIGSDSNSFHYVCTYCGRGFKRLARYNSHLSRHSSQISDLKKSVIDENCTYKCNICNRGYKTKHLLKAHKLTHGEKSFLCSECGKGFVTKAALQSHFKVHTGEKPHTCNVCSKSFAHVGSFEAHILIHTGQKPYNCNICKKAFTQLSHLKYHMRTHSGERPYTCTYCSKSFALKGNLTVHVRTHTGETPYVCSICGKGFYDSSSMKKHKRRHENNFIDGTSSSPIALNNIDTDVINNAACLNSSMM